MLVRIILHLEGLAIAVAAVWAFIAGSDRLPGYGLMYPAHFKDTHMQRL